MDKNIQDMLGGVLSNLPGDLKEKVQNCKSKEDFLGIIGGGNGGGFDLGSIGGSLGGLFGGGGGSNDNNGGGSDGGDSAPKADNNPLGAISGMFGGGKGFDLGGIIGQAGDLLKNVDWSEIQNFITGFFNKKK